MMELVWNGSQKHTYLAALKGVPPFSERRLSEPEPPPSQMATSPLVLQTLQRWGGPMTRRQIINETRRPYQSVSVILERLTRRGLIHASAKEPGKPMLFTCASPSEP